MELEYQNHKLHLRSPGSSLDLLELCEKIKSPFYLYHCDAMLERLKILKNFMPQNTTIHYAMKANDNSFLLKRFKELGVGVDLVSGGELEIALASHFTPKDVVFSGVGKTVSEIEGALLAGIKQLNVESPAELRRIGEVAKVLGKKAPVAFRMNPDVNPETHPYIRTGFRENKFGMDDGFLPELKHIMSDYADHLKLVGLTMHIGSQIRELEPYREAVRKLLPLYEDLKAAGHPMGTFDVGGGIGIDYESDYADGDLALLKGFGDMLKEELSHRVREILIEPGRVVVGRFGWLFGEVQYIKNTPHKNFVILNTGMHHLLRPALYQAHHRIVPVYEHSGRAQLYDVVGPICESSDVVGSDRLLSPIKQGDWLAICDAGAYGAVMASRYNAHALPEEYIFYKGTLHSSGGEVI